MRRFSPRPFASPLCPTLVLEAKQLVVTNFSLENNLKRNYYKYVLKELNSNILSLHQIN